MFRVHHVAGLPSSFRTAGIPRRVLRFALYFHSQPITVAMSGVSGLTSLIEFSPGPDL